MSILRAAFQGLVRTILAYRLALSIGMATAASILLHAIWPWPEGNPLLHLFSMERPGIYMGVSMQWMALYNSSEGIYLAARDGFMTTPPSYKELRFGYDSNIDYSSNGSRLMAMPLWVFVAPPANNQGQTVYNSPPIDLGLYSKGDWWWPADQYRNYQLNAYLPIKHYSSEAAELTALNGVNIPVSTQQSPVTYDGYTPPQVSGAEQPYGIYNDFIFGWNVGGFDYNYPDFQPDSARGGETGSTGLQQMVADSQSTGAKVSLYINAWDMDTVSSTWYASNGAAAVALEPPQLGGGAYPGYNLNSHTGAPASPSYQPYQTQLTNVVSTNRYPIGANFQFLDQVMEAQAWLDFGQHGQSSPATSYTAGYYQMMQGFQNVFNDNGMRNDYFFMAEGQSDYLSPFIDVGALNFARGYGYDPATAAAAMPDESVPSGRDAPQVTRYTLLQQLMGQSYVGQPGESQYPGLVGQTDEYAWAFQMGAPLPSNGRNPAAFPRYLNIYQSQPDIYFYGIYKDSRGITIQGSSAVTATTIVGKNSDRMGIQLYNSGTTAQSVSVSLDLSQIGMNAQGRTLAGVYNLEYPQDAITGSISGNIVSFTTDSNHSVNNQDVAAYMVVFNDGIAENDSNGNPIQTTYYTLSNASTGKSLAVSSCQQYNFQSSGVLTTASGAGQNWQLFDVGNGFFMLVTQCSGSTLATSILNGSETNFTPAVLWPSNGNASQYFKVEHVSGGYRLIAASGNTLTVNGSNIDTELWSGSPSQVWTLNPQSAAPALPLITGAWGWEIMSKASDLTMDGAVYQQLYGLPYVVQNNPWAPSQSVSNYETQAMVISPVSNTSPYYTIRMANAAGYLMASSNQGGANIEVSGSYTADCYHQWQITPIRDGFFTIASSCNTALNVALQGGDTSVWGIPLVLQSAPSSAASTPDNELWRLALQISPQ